MKKGKLFAPFLTLLAAAVTLLVTLLSGYKLNRIAWILLIVIIVFYIIGSLIASRVTKFVVENEAKAQEEAEKEGAVIEKEAPSAEGDSPDGVRGSLPPLTGVMPDVPDVANEQPDGGFRERP